MTFIRPFSGDIPGTGLQSGFSMGRLVLLVLTRVLSLQENFSGVSELLIFFSASPLVHSPSSSFHSQETGPRSWVSAVHFRSQLTLHSVWVFILGVGGGSGREKRTQEHHCVSAPLKYKVTSPHVGRIKPHTLYQAYFKNTLYNSISMKSLSHLCSVLLSLSFQTRLQYTEKLQRLSEGHQPLSLWRVKFCPHPESACPQK